MNATLFPSGDQTGDISGTFGGAAAADEIPNSVMPSAMSAFTAQVYAYDLSMNETWPIERAGELLDAWVRWTSTNAVGSLARVLSFPPLPEFPEHVRGKAFVVVETGTTSELAQLVREQPFAVVSEKLMLSGLDAEGVAKLVALCGAQARSPLLALEIHHVRADEFWLLATGFATTDESVDGFEIHMRQLRETLAPWAAAAA
jgi:hypothetical protein